MLKIRTKLLAAALIACGLVFAQNVAVLGFVTYYAETNKEYISKGVIYEEQRRITDMGLLDVYILRIPADDPNIILSAAASQTEVGLKETAVKLLSDTGAIAGVNGDFFGTAGSYSMPMGLQVDTNGVTSISNFVNQGVKKYSSFMLADDGNYFMAYVTAGIRFFNNGQENIILGSMNKVADLAGSTVLTSDFLSSTAEIDARIDGAVKIVVRNNYIAYISAKGETVNVPEDGYVVIMSSATADECLWHFAVGQYAQLSVEASVNLNSISAAISGGGRMLVSGQYVTEGSYYITGIQPRTAIGMSADGKEIILMVVDGRSHSIGVSHEELAQLMQEAGAYNAMHLDGGGSTEMAVQKPGDTGLQIVNYPSGGFERKLINALGIYVQKPAGTSLNDVRELVIRTYNDTVVTGSPAKVEVYGLDEYMRRIEIPSEFVGLSSSNGGSFYDVYFTAYAEGTYKLTATAGGFTATCEVYATELYELRPSVKEIKTSVGGKTELTYTGVGQNGNIFEIDPQAVSVEVVSSGLGNVRNSVFMAESVGTGWLRCYIGGVSTYIPVYATILAQNIDTLSGTKYMSFSSYPANVTGGAYYVNIPNYYQKVARLDYHFDIADFTQAAYADISGLDNLVTKGFRLSVYGDLSGNWLRGRVTDAEGNQYLIDFARVLDWESWKEVEVWLPESAVLPVTIDRIYIASTSSEIEVESTVYFCNLRGLYDYTWQYPEVVTPASNTFRDAMWVEFYDWTEYGYDITFMPDVSAPSEGSANTKRAGEVFLFNASAGIYMGTFGDSFRNDHYWTLQQNNPVLAEYSTEFKIYGAGSLFVVQTTASGKDGNNGLMFADKTQWSKLSGAIASSYSNNILIMCDVSPLDFSNKKEYDLLHSLLRSYVRKGKNIFVLSSGGTAPDVSVVDGVRYVTLPALYSDGELNESFSVLRFRLKGDDIKYSIECIFK